MPPKKGTQNKTDKPDSQSKQTPRPKERKRGWWLVVRILTPITAYLIDNLKKNKELPYTDKDYLKLVVITIPLWIIFMGIILAFSILLGILIFLLVHLSLYLMKKIAKIMK